MKKLVGTFLAKSLVEHLAIADAQISNVILIGLLILLHVCL
jgi:hypothetical protein